MPINENLTIIDSPGFVFNTINDIKEESIKGQIKPKTFQMKENEILAIDSMF